MQKISDNILALLEQCTVQGNEVVMNCGQLDRKTYEQLNKVLVALGGKWTRKVGAHVFSDNPSVRIEEALLTGEYSNEKKDFGFFETPPELADELVQLANLVSGHKVLEPSAGRGALARACAKKIPKKDIYCLELIVDNWIALQDAGFKARHKNFLLANPKPVFDRVIMNPPFSAPGAPQLDIDHVLHAFKFLKPEGRLVAIMSAGLTFRSNKKTKEFRAKVKAIQENPPEAFKVSGTSVRTVMVVMEKEK